MNKKITLMCLVGLALAFGCDDGNDSSSAAGSDGEVEAGAGGDAGAGGGGEAEAGTAGEAGEAGAGGEAEEAGAGDEAEAGTGGAPMQTAVEVDVDLFYPEGVTIVPGSNESNDADTLYVGSFTTGQIYRASLSDLQVSEYVAADAVSGGIVGIKWAAGALWACAAAKDPTMEPSALVRFNDEGQVDSTYPLGIGTFCNDFVVSSAGEIYVTDSISNRIFKLTADASELSEWYVHTTAPAEGAFGFNGIVFNQDETALHVGSFETGNLVRVAIDTDGSAGEGQDETVTPASPFGIDGLCWVGETLYAIRGFGVATLDLGDENGWIASSVETGPIDSATTLDVDSDGNLWVVESQFSMLFDGSDSTDGSAPFRVVRVTP